MRTTPTLSIFLGCAALIIATSGIVEALDSAPAPAGQHTRTQAVQGRGNCQIQPTPERAGTAGRPGIADTSGRGAPEQVHSREAGGTADINTRQKAAKKETRAAPQNRGIGSKNRLRANTDSSRCTGSGARSGRASAGSGGDRGRR